MKAVMMKAAKRKVHENNMRESFKKPNKIWLVGWLIVFVFGSFFLFDESPSFARDLNS